MPNVRLEQVEQRIVEACRRAGRPRASVALVAVVKLRPPGELHALYDLGVRVMAENRVQELRERGELMPRDVQWHLIGSLQTNKAKYLPGLAAWVHSLDRVDLADALEKAWEKHPKAPPLRALIQVNIAGEEQKHGCAPGDARALLEHCRGLRRVSVEGLMCMAPFSDDPEASRPVFKALRALRDELQEQTGIPLPQLSMGMSGDFEVAIEEGATLVRVGSALFE